MIKRFFCILIFAMVLVVAIQNVVINESNKVLDVVALLNIEALASEENGGGDGWTVKGISIIHRLNDVLVYECEGVSCAKEGPMSSCNASCKERHKNGDSWGEWQSCGMQ